MMTGSLASDVIFPAGGPWSADVRAHAPIASINQVRLLAHSLGGVPAPHLPLATVHAARTASRPATSFEITDWYYRIHVTPGELILGNVVSNEQFTVGVWNAWLTTSQTLEVIGATLADGVSLIGQPVPPLVFTPNQQRNYTVEVLTLGPPTIGTVYTFTFGDSEAPTLTLTGQRITAWALTPDWQTPVRERIGFLTDVMRAWSGVEQRRALRIAPRRAFSFATFAQTIEKNFIENALFAWSAMIWALPIFPDGQRSPAGSNPGDTSVAADTVNRDFIAGGLAILIKDAANFEILQILSVAPAELVLVRPVVGTWPARSRLYPVRAARLLSYPRLSRESQNLFSISPEFTIVEPCDWPAASGLPIYRTLPVLEDSPDVSGTQPAEFTREANMTDNVTGSIDVDDMAQMGFPGVTHQWFLRGRTARAAFRSLLYALKGRLGMIWVPSYDADTLIVDSIAVGVTQITVAAAGYAQFAAVQNRRDIRIELYSGTILYRRIVGAAAGTVSGTEVLELDSAIGIAILPAQIRRVSFMALSRLDADEIEIQHLTMSDGLATAQTPFKALNYEPVP